jgi:thiol:disulfide interchange protein
VRNERVWFILSLILYTAGLVTAVRETGWDSIRWVRYPVFIPTGLLALCVINSGLRSKLLAWSVFTLSFVCLVAVLGAFVIQFRTIVEVPWFAFVRAFVMYLAFSMTGLCQLRPVNRQQRRHPNG